MTLLAEPTTTYEQRRERARELGARFDFAQQPLGLYLAIVDAQERAFERARSDRPSRDDLSSYVVRTSLPGVMEAAVAAGTETFLARASTQPVLEALPDLAATLRGSEATDDRHCPRCGGLPQVAVFPETGEALLTAQRTLVCSRCADAWVMSRMTCASCGETSGAKMPILSDVDLFPHLRIDACEMCRRYLITVDQRKDSRAVPIVDELAALPLDLVAAERGYTKIARNLMGF